MAIKWLSKLFSSTGAKTIRSLGNIIDDVHTSKEEKITAITARLLSLDNTAKNHEQALERELTERLKIDSKSDSWLSRNVRPFILLFLTFAVSLLSFLTVLDVGLTEDQLESLGIWVPFYTTLMVTAYGFYFGSRGYEKVTKIKEDKKRGDR